jgi:4-amino-4-deoxy-L-arabinose transferase-like glycosyltransferase
MTFPLKWPLRLKFGSWFNLVLAGLIIIIIGTHAISVRFLHSPFMDEPILVSRAWSWLQTGLNFGALDAGVVEKKFDGYWTFHPLIPTWLHAFFIFLFGLNLTGVRVASLFCSIVLSIAVFCLSYQLTRSYRAALIAVLLLVSSISFALSARVVRYDIIVAMFGFAAISAFWAGAKRGSFGLGLLSGVLLGLAFETHMSGAVYGPVVAALIFARWGMPFYKEKAFWGVAAGGFALLLSYLWFHVIRYPETYIGMGRGFAGTHYPPLIAGSVSAFVTAFLEMGTFIFIMTQLGIIAIITAMIMLWRNREGTIPLLMVVVGLISFTLLIKAKNFYYFIIIAPFLYIVVAEWIEIYGFGRRSLHSFWKFGTALGLALLLINIPLGLTGVFASFSSVPIDDDTKLVSRRIERYLPVGGSLMGMQFYWFDLHRYRYISWQQILAYRIYEPEGTFDDAMTALRPDVFVIDDQLRDFIFEDIEEPPKFGFDRYRWERRLMKSDIKAFLDRRGKLADKIQTNGLGLIEIYTIDWADKGFVASSP